MNVELDPDFAALVVASLEANTQQAAKNDQSLNSTLNGVLQLNETIRDHSVKVERLTVKVQALTEQTVELNERVETMQNALYARVAGHDDKISKLDASVRDMAQHSLGHKEVLSDKIDKSAASVDRKLKEATDQFATIAKETVTAAQATPAAQVIRAYRDLDAPARRILAWLILAALIFLSGVAVVAARIYIGLKVNERPPALERVIDKETNDVVKH